MNDNGTRFEFVSGAGAAPQATVLLVPLLAKPQTPLELVTRVDTICDQAVSDLIAVKAVGDDVGQLAHTTRSATYRRVIVVSLGEAEKLTPETVRKAAAVAARWLISAKIARAALWVDTLVATGVTGAVAEWAAGMTVAGFRFNEYKKPDKDVPAKIRMHVCSSEAEHIRRLLPQIREEVTVAEAVNYTRRLAHLPGNVINPATLAAEARKLTEKSRLKCTVLEAAQVKKLGMGGLVAVGAGATPGPCLIQIEYKAAPRSRRLVVLVGKAITFDTGGYSIKPSANLDAMKFDKCGGTTVLGIMKAIADLKLKCNVIGLVPAAENAVSDRAYRPGDIVTMLSGKTVEIISTDAEGRLVLADALTYAQKKFKPTEIIDLATLTGGVTVALGKEAAGLMSNNDELAAELGECGRRTRERLWRLPLWDEYRELIRGTEADIKNSSTKREAHAIVGGMFLKEFVADAVAWAHLDIAAVATSDENGGLTGKGATGFGVRLLVDYLRR
ncbi:MAG: leucyl aminopeptidase [Phycisphaerae bacterium]|jgi:leucyl aminopeptidase